MKNIGLQILSLASKMEHASRDSPRSQWLFQDNPNVLCECFLQTGFLHTSQLCFTLLASTFPFCSPSRTQIVCRISLQIPYFRALLRAWCCSKLRHQTHQ